MIIDGGSEFEPDIMIAVAREDDYLSGHPTGADVVLVIEVSDESLKKDRELKLPRYAAAGIPEYWIVNLRQHQIERYTPPEPAQSEIDLPARYGEIKVFSVGGIMSHPMLGEVSVATFLPAAAE